MTNKAKYHGLPAAPSVQQALAAALQLESEAALAARSGNQTLYAELHQAASIQWQMYRAELSKIILQNRK